MSFLFGDQSNYSKTIKKSLLLRRDIEKDFKQQINKYWNYQANCYYLKKLILVEYRSPDEFS